MKPRFYQCVIPASQGKTPRVAVEVTLMYVFHADAEEAHHRAREWERGNDIVAGTYTRDVAETKAAACGSIKCVLQKDTVA